MAMHIPKAPGFSSMLKEGARVSEQFESYQFACSCLQFCEYFWKKFIS
jgi:hypothetical protein